MAYTFSLLQQENMPVHETEVREWIKEGELVELEKFKLGL